LIAPTHSPKTPNGTNSVAIAKEERQLRSKRTRPGGIRYASRNTSTARLERVLGPRINWMDGPRWSARGAPRARAASKRQS